MLSRFRKKRRVAHKDPTMDESETGSYQSSDDISIEDDDEDYHSGDYKFEIPSFVMATRCVPPSEHMWTREDTLPHIRKMRSTNEKKTLPTKDNLAYLNEFCHEAVVPTERPPSYDAIPPSIEKEPHDISNKHLLQKPDHHPIPVPFNEVLDRPSTSAQADELEKASSAGALSSRSSYSEIHGDGDISSPHDDSRASHNVSPSKTLSAKSDRTSGRGTSESTNDNSGARSRNGQRKRGKTKPYVPLSKRLPKPVKPKIYKSNRPLKVDQSKLQERLKEIAKQNEDKLYNPQGEAWRNLVTKIFPQEESRKESDC